MKSRFAVSLLCLLSLACAKAGEPVPVTPEMLEWNYTLAVQKGNHLYSFSLMKDGSLAFDQWGTDEDLVEAKIDLTAEQSHALKGDFDALFNALKSSAPETVPPPPMYVLEKVSETVTTLNLPAPQPKIEAFLEQLSKLSGKPLPFTLNANYDEPDQG